MAKIIRVRPDNRAGEKERVLPNWRTLFLEGLAETSNVSEAADRARINPRRAYQVRREDLAFRQEWQAALLEGYDHLETETLHRLRMGFEAGKDDRKFDIANALRLLSLHKETVARARALEGDEDEDAILASLNAKIDAMRAREAAVDALLAAETDGE